MPMNSDKFQVRMQQLGFCESYRNAKTVYRSGLCRWYEADAGGSLKGEKRIRVIRCRFGFQIALRTGCEPPLFVHSGDRVDHIVFGNDLVRIFPHPHKHSRCVTTEKSSDLIDCSIWFNDGK